MKRKQNFKKQISSLLFLLLINSVMIAQDFPMKLPEGYRSSNIVGYYDLDNDGHKETIFSSLNSKLKKTYDGKQTTAYWWQLTAISIKDGMMLKQPYGSKQESWTGQKDKLKYSFEFKDFDDDGDIDFSVQTIENISDIMLVTKDYMYYNNTNEAELSERKAFSFIKTDPAIKKTLFE